MSIIASNEEVRGINVYIKPTYAVVLPARDRERGPLTELQKLNLQNLVKNTPEGELSKKAQTRLVNSVNWLVASARKKYIYDKTLNKRFAFRVNFVTLTLPTFEHGITDHKFKAVLLHAFINSCRYRYDLKNFVWKVEAQANGNIHAHFTTDTYLPWRGIRDVWNKILEKHGVIEKYRAKFRAMSEMEYVARNMIGNDTPLDVLHKRYHLGQSTDWSDPNTTDVHAVHKVKDIGAYLAKYMSKKEEGRRKLKGRLWSCSYSIAKANKLSISIPFQVNTDALRTFFNDAIGFKALEIKDKMTGLPRKVGEIFLFNLSDWFTIITGPIAEVYKKTLFNIRNNIDVDALYSIAEAPLVQHFTNELPAVNYSQLDFFINTKNSTT